MTRQDLILQIRQAYISHIRWRSTAKALHLGMPIIEKDIAASAEACDFGLWFYQEGKILSTLETYQTIDKLHKRIHHIYQSIVKIHDKSHHKIKRLHLYVEDEMDEKRQICSYFKDLSKVSKELLHLLKELETEVKTLPESLFSE